MNNLVALIVIIVLLFEFVVFSKALKEMGEYAMNKENEIDNYVQEYKETANNYLN